MFLLNNGPNLSTIFSPLLPITYPPIPISSNFQNSGSKIGVIKCVDNCEIEEKLSEQEKQICSSTDGKIIIQNKNEICQCPETEIVGAEMRFSPILGCSPICSERGFRLENNECIEYNIYEKDELDDLHKFGHNLQKIMEEICTNELIYISKEEKTLIDLTNQMYKDKEFEYITLGYKNPPKILLLHSTTSSLLDKATKYISTPK